MKTDHVSSCSSCNTTTPFLLHHIYLRQNHRHLCSPCVLKTHPGSFCPLCFQLFPSPPPPPNSRLMCLTCPSISHLTCTNNTTSYQCPSCKDPDYFSFHNRIDLNSAEKFLAAAKIAANSMSKAASIARVEAEKRVKEALIAKKRAKEALEEFEYLVEKESNSGKNVIQEDVGVFVKMTDIVVSEGKKRKNV